MLEKHVTLDVVFNCLNVYLILGFFFNFSISFKYFGIAKRLLSLWLNFSWLIFFILKE